MLDNAITINITAYDDRNHSIVVNFSDGVHTTSNVGFQVFNYHDYDIDTCLKKLAIVGSKMIETCAKQAQYLANTETVNTFRNLANTSHTINIDDTFDENDLEVKV